MGAMNPPACFQPPARVLMGPGPSDVPASVLAALGKPTIGHLDPVFLALLDETRAMLRTVFGTANELTMPMSGTGSAGMETCIVNTISPGDRVLVGVHGVFGEDERMLAAQQAAIDANPDYEFYSLNIDAGGMWVRRLLERMLAAEGRSAVPAVR